MRVGVSAAARCVTDIAVAAKKSFVKYIKLGKAFIAHTDGANIFSLTHVVENLYTIRVQTKGDHDKKKNKGPLENDARTTSRPIVVLSSAQNTASDRFSQTHFVFGRFRENGKPVPGRF